MKSTRLCRRIGRKRKNISERPCTCFKQLCVASMALDENNPRKSWKKNDTHIVQHYV